MAAMEEKRRRGDRKDAKLVRNADSMHVIMPYLFPKRTDNEAVCNETLDITEALRYIEEKNAQNPEFKYTLFHFICAAVAKTVALRPRMNRFISGYRLYERNDITIAFVAKKKFTDNGEEALVKVKLDKNSDSVQYIQTHVGVGYRMMKV